MSNRGKRRRALFDCRIIGLKNGIANLCFTDSREGTAFLKIDLRKLDIENPVMDMELTLETFKIGGKNVLRFVEKSRPKEDPNRDRNAIYRGMFFGV
jgi:hypothetical protein